MQTTDIGEAAQGALNESRSFLSRQVDERTTELGARVNEAAQDLRGVGDRLRVNSTIGPAATLVDQGADIVERVGTYLTDADSDRLLRDAETIVRAQPWAVAAGAFVVGFAASRFLKTSSARRYAADASAPSLSASYDGKDALKDGSSSYAGTSSRYGAPDDYAAGDVR